MSPIAEKSTEMGTENSYKTLTRVVSMELQSERPIGVNLRGNGRRENGKQKYKPKELRIS